MIHPVPLIFIVEGLDDVYIYSSVEEAALSLEPWWVEQNEGSAYDSEGRLLEFGIDKYNVVISLGEWEPLHSLDLRSILLSYLNAVGEKIENESDTNLASLVKFCSDRANHL